MQSYCNWTAIHKMSLYKMRCNRKTLCISLHPISSLYAEVGRNILWNRAYVCVCVCVCVCMYMYVCVCVCVCVCIYIYIYIYTHTLNIHDNVEIEKKYIHAWLATRFMYLLEYHNSSYSGWHFLITSTDYNLALRRVLPVSSNSTGTDLASGRPYMFLFLKHTMFKDNTPTTISIHFYSSSDTK